MPLSSASSAPEAGPCSAIVRRPECRACLLIALQSPRSSKLRQWWQAVPPHSHLRSGMPWKPPQLASPPAAGRSIDLNVQTTVSTTTTAAGRVGPPYGERLPHNRLIILVRNVARSVLLAELSQSSVQISRHAFRLIGSLLAQFGVRVAACATCDTSEQLMTTLSLHKMQMRYRRLLCDI